MEENKLELYEKAIRHYAENRIDEPFFNDGDDCAKIVFKYLFKTAQKEIKIFSGSLAKKEFPDNSYVAELTNFIRNGGKVSILVQHHNQIDKDSILFSNLSRLLKSRSFPDFYLGRTKRKVLLKSHENTNEIHFTIADDKAFRIETDINTRSAMCNFNRSTIAEKYSQLFNQLKEDSVTISL